MVAILRIFDFTGPNLSLLNLVGLIIMIPGALVAFFSGAVCEKILKRPENELPVKIAGLIAVIIGFIITVYVKG